VRLCWDGAEHAGRAVELGDADPATVAAALREGSQIACPTPSAAHEHVGVIRPETSVSLRAALAAAARTRGASAPEDDEIAALEAKRGEIEAEQVDLKSARERLAAAGTTEQELRERMARLGGKAEARRELDADDDGVEADLRETAAALSEAETERIAAEQALEAARERARAERDKRERRRRLSDRIENRRRKARERLATAWYDDFCDALGRVPTPEPVSAGESPAAYESDGASAALAVAALADLRAPVVAACGRFESARAAHETLNVPVIRVQNSS